MAVTTRLVTEVTTQCIRGTLFVNASLFNIVPGTGSELILVVKFQFKLGALDGLNDSIADLPNVV